MEVLPTIHLCATCAGAFQSAGDVSPPSALASPLTFAQSDDRLHLLRIEVVGVEHPQELGGTQQLIDVVVVVWTVGVGVRVGYQVAEVFVEPWVDGVQCVRLALIASLQQVDGCELLLLKFCQFVVHSSGTSVIPCRASLSILASPSFSASTPFFVSSFTFDGVVL